MWSDLSSLLEDDFSFYRDFVEDLEPEENIFKYNSKIPTSLTFIKKYVNGTEKEVLGGVVQAFNLGKFDVERNVYNISLYIDIYKPMSFCCDYLDPPSKGKINGYEVEINNLVDMKPLGTPEHYGLPIRLTYVGTARIKANNDIAPIVKPKQIEKRKVFKYVTTYKTKPFKVPGHKKEFVLECGTYKWVEE